MAELVTELEQVTDNVARFNRDLSEGKPICSRLSHFRDWYYIEAIGQFGPSKFIGYKGMTSERYQDDAVVKVAINGKSRNLSGLHSEKALKKWFEPIAPNDERYERLYASLSAMLSEHRKQLNKSARIRVQKR